MNRRDSITIPLEKVVPGMILAKDINTIDSGFRYLLPQNSILTESAIKRLHEFGIAEITILGNPESNGQEIVVDPLDYPEPNPTIHTRLRYNALDSLEDFFHMAETGNSQHTVKIIKHMDAIVDELIDSVADDKKSFVNINDLRSYDEYTYHHSLSVAVLSIAIGQSMGLGRNELKVLARGAMMHDIGKTSVPVELIQKPSRLNEKEFEIVKGHSAHGYQYLFDHNIGDKTMRQGVLSHHERYDGNGYPLNLAGGTIPVIGRIIAVADVYDALTSNRPYRVPMQTAEAIEYVMGSVGSQFDYDVVKAFLQKIELYPVGTYVELSDQRVAVVMNNVNPLRPVVKCVATGEVLDLLNDSRCLSLTIINTYDLPPAF